MEARVVKEKLEMWIRKDKQFQTIPVLRNMVLIQAHRPQALLKGVVLLAILPRQLGRNIFEPADLVAAGSAEVGVAVEYAYALDKKASALNSRLKHDEEVKGYAMVCRTMLQRKKASFVVPVTVLGQEGNTGEDEDTGFEGATMDD